MTDDPQTECHVSVEDWYFPASVNGRQAAGPPEFKQHEFINTVGFAYSNDVLNLGDPFSFSIANPQGRYSQRFQRGSTVKFFLKNPSVNGGKLTLKHEGIITNRTARADKSGCFLDVQCADRGWHLRENDAPLWFRLQNATLEGLLQNTKFIDPSWGLKGPIADNATTVLMRRGLNHSRAQIAIDQQTMGTTVYIQVEPGDKIADLISVYCRRIGRLFTVSPDGYMQIWTPDETKIALYSINFHGFDSVDRERNTVISVQITEDISSIWTVCTCIGERAGGEIARNTTSQNDGKYPGTFVNSYALPFRHNVNFTDGDIFDISHARKQAAWRYGRGAFDAWTATYTVRGHHCQGDWWEADTFVTVHDSVNGLDGDFYVSAVAYTRDDRGDLTVLTLKQPHLLRASFGVFPRAPRYPVATVIPVAGTESQTKLTTTEAK